jgi:hypothetical protein
VGDTKEIELFSPGQLELVCFLKKGENYINGKELIERAKQLEANLGRRQAKHLMEREKEILKKEWWHYDIVFTGTIWVDRRGRHRVLYLYCQGQHWYSDFRQLNGNFFEYRLPRPRK